MPMRNSENETIRGCTWLDAAVDVDDPRCRSLRENVADVLRRHMLGIQRQNLLSGLAAGESESQRSGGQLRSARPARGKPPAMVSAAASTRKPRHQEHEASGSCSHANFQPGECIQETAFHSFDIGAPKTPWTDSSGRCSPLPTVVTDNTSGVAGPVETARK